jgi:FtsZ-interacting cell division protein ZipA
MKNTLKNSNQFVILIMVIAMLFSGFNSSAQQRNKPQRSAPQKSAQRPSTSSATKKSVSRPSSTSTTKRPSASSTTN